MRSFEIQRRGDADAVFQVTGEAGLLQRSHSHGRATAPGTDRHGFRNYGEIRRCVWPLKIHAAGLAAPTLAIGIGDSAAVVNQVDALQNLRFESAAPDADVAGTVAIALNDSISTTSGVVDLGGTRRAGRIRLKGNAKVAYTCTLPAQIQLSSGANTVDDTNFTTNNPSPGHGAKP